MANTSRWRVQVETRHISSADGRHQSGLGGAGDSGGRADRVRLRSPGTSLRTGLGHGRSSSNIVLTITPGSDIFGGIARQSRSPPADPHARACQRGQEAASPVTVDAAGLRWPRSGSTGTGRRRRRPVTTFWPRTRRAPASVGLDAAVRRRQGTRRRRCRSPHLHRRHHSGGRRAVLASLPEAHDQLVDAVGGEPGRVLGDRSRRRFPRRRGGWRSRAPGAGPRTPAGTGRA